MSQVKQIAEAVVAKLNEGELLENPAILDYAPEFDLPDFKNLTVTVGPVRRNSKRVTRSKRIPEVNIAIAVQKRVKTADEIEAMLDLCESIDDLFDTLSVPACKAELTEIEQDTLFDFANYRENRLFETFFTLTFKVM
jgi:FKBP-type peptidyl-prolyl cis-trans isomerase (trigger factor)